MFQRFPPIFPWIFQLIFQEVPPISTVKSWLNPESLQDFYKEILLKSTGIQFHHILIPIIFEEIHVPSPRKAATFSPAHFPWPGHPPPPRWPRAARPAPTPTPIDPPGGAGGCWAGRWWLDWWSAGEIFEVHSAYFFGGKIIWKMNLWLSGFEKKCWIQGISWINGGFHSHGIYGIYGGLMMISDC